MNLAKCEGCGIRFRLHPTKVHPSTFEDSARLIVNKESMHFCTLRCLANWLGEKLGLLVTSWDALQNFGKMFHESHEESEVTNI